MKRLFSLFIFCVFLFSFVSPVSALTKSGEQVIIPENQTVNETLYATGESIEIQGIVNGDVLCAGSSIKVTGQVNGDLLCAGQTITVTGVVNGNIRSAGEVLNLEGQVNRNVMFFGQSLNQKAESSIGGEIFLVVQKATLDGTVGKKVTGGVQSLTINGAANSVDVSGDDIIIGTTASISGNLVYSSKDPAQIASSSAIGGVITQNPPKVNQEDFKQAFATFALVLVVVWKVTLFILLLVLATIVALLFPKFSQDVSTVMKTNALHSILWGLLFVVVSFVIIGLLFVTLVGIPLALFGLLIFCMIMFLARIFVAIFIGDLIMRKLRSNSKTPLALSTILGVIITWVVFQIPLLGTLISMIAGFWGLGALFLASRNKQKSW